MFNYFDSKECTQKPIVTLMFTDGWYYDNWCTPSMKKKYKDTIWIMNRDYNPNFKPPFGKLAKAKFKDE